jgi:diadenosine tetraphosphate (Ap4A) HIT family hydrolase
MSTSCLFCKMVAGAFPCHKIYETQLTLAFLDINPLSKVLTRFFIQGHALVISKAHAQMMHELPDESLADLLPVAKKVAIAVGAGAYNILQNNGRLAHQVKPPYLKTRK